MINGAGRTESLGSQNCGGRGGYDWTKRYPWIIEAALKNCQRHFVIDGEAVILGVDGYSDFDASHSGRHNEEVQLCAFDVLAIDGVWG
jgi:bifunctional non-homologous end joining protein LigD